MSKAAKEQKNFPPTKKTPEMPSVEKVVNQRYTSKALFKRRWKKRVQGHMDWKAFRRGHLG